jgi:3-hydroxyisobutyrate dehydrogenase-like beta-hydroxyacid dehydrogenase
MATIAWLGTGLLGSGFVKAALKRGDRVRVWNRTASKAKALESLGAVFTATPSEAVKGAERVHLCLSDDAAVDGVLEEILAAPGFNAPIIDHTTVTPKGAKARAERLEKRGVGFLACPVFMGPAMAESSSGRMLCAGPVTLVEALGPALAKMTGELQTFGTDVSVPATLKLLGNSMIIGISGVLADAIAVAQGGGVDVKEAIAFLQSFQVGNIVNMRGVRMSQGDYTASFELTMARKDVRLMQETAAPRAMATLDGLGARMDALIAKGHGAKDLGALAIELVPAKS